MFCRLTLEMVIIIYPGLHSSGLGVIELHVYHGLDLMPDALSGATLRIDPGLDKWIKG